MNNRLSTHELESYVWGAATLLRGLVDAGDYQQFIFPLHFYERPSDVWDEEHSTALAHTGDMAYARATADDRSATPEAAYWPTGLGHAGLLPRMRYT
jgi:type I restriction enzyme M protein